MVKLTDNQKKLAAARQAAFYNRNNEMIYVLEKHRNLVFFHYGKDTLHETGSQIFQGVYR